MTGQILGLAIEFLIRSAFLGIALWVMIKIQKLEWDLLGLLLSTALGSGLDMIPIVGHYLAVPALWLCLKQVTNGDLFPDVAFTVGISYALVFCMNLFVIGSLLGDLRPSKKHAEVAPPERTAVSKDKPEADGPPTATKPAPVVAAQPPDPKPVQQPTNQPIKKSTREMVRNFSVKGILEGIDKPVGTISSGLKTYTLIAGETRSMETENGRIAVRFDGVSDHQVILTISGEQIALSY
jgi:hypothetical protein